MRAGVASARKSLSLQLLELLTLRVTWRSGNRKGGRTHRVRPRSEISKGYRLFSCVFYWHVWLSAFPLGGLANWACNMSINLDMVFRTACHAAVYVLCSSRSSYHFRCGEVIGKHYPAPRIAIRTPNLFLHELCAKGWGPNSSFNNLHAIVLFHASETLLVLVEHVTQPINSNECEERGLFEHHFAN